MADVIYRRKRSPQKHGIQRRVFPIPTAEFPEEGLVRISDFVSDRDAKGIFPGTRNTWLKGVEDKKFPPPVLIGNIRYWRAEHVRAVVEGRDWRSVEVAL